MNYMKRRTHATMSKGRSSCVNFKWAKKGKIYESMAPIASNKNGQRSKKNLAPVIGAINAQLLT
jgi:hypothetical protein